jgi:hypothetical protein
VVDQDAQDTFFFDPRDAWAVAQQGRRVQLTKWVSSPQMCYYTGEHVFPDAPPHLVHVPFERVAEFFHTTRLRMPKQVSFPLDPTLTVEQQTQRARLSSYLKAQLLEACDRLSVTVAQYTSAMRECAVDIAPGEPLRVFAYGSIQTTVMQHCSRSLLGAFADLGHDCHFVIERDELERMTWDVYQRAALDFAPHLVLNINHQNHDLVPQGAANVIWWQDMMRELVEGRPLNWNDNDLVYVLSRDRFAPLLERCGLPRERLRVQPFCIDRTIFNEVGAGEREDTVVFVGSSYIRELSGKPEEVALLEELSARFTAGEPLTAEVVNEAADRHYIRREWADWHVLHFIARDLPVRWLCQQRKVKVEVYGRDWERDPIVAPFFKGELPPGKAVADVYRRARWALVLHPDMINHQRLGEVGACGCIPVVHDCRFRADGPFWEDQVLYFRTPEDLAGSFSRQPRIDAQAFGEHFDYANFARRILADAEAIIAKAPAGVLP